jgi:hypothetical protein
MRCDFSTETRSPGKVAWMRARFSKKTVLVLGPFLSTRGGMGRIVVL